MSDRLQEIARSHKLKTLSSAFDPGEGTSKGAEESVLENWSEGEKVDLLMALKTYGSKNLEAIAAQMGTKTVQDIEKAIKFYKANVANVFTEEKKSRLYDKAREKSLHDSLTYWINLLRRDITESELQTNLGKAFQIIGECEKMPPFHQTNGVDFKNMYLAIADILKGDEPRQLKDIEKTVMKSLLQETICEAEKALETINVDMELWKDPKSVVLPRPSLTEDAELAALELLISQINCNPFGMDSSRLHY